MSALITFALAVGSVGLWTLRVALTARGSRMLGSSVAATEAVVFVIAFSHVTGALNAPVQIGIYGIGVGMGTFLGLTIDRRIKDHQPRSRRPVVASVMDGSHHEEVTTLSMSPGANSITPRGVSNAQATSPGDP